MVTDSCYISNKVFTKCFFIFRSSVIIMWARQSASCLKAASWPFNVTQGHLLKSGPFPPAAWAENPMYFPTLFHYEWFLWVCLKELGELVWKAFCSVRWIKFIAISAAKHLTMWVQMNQTLQTLQPTVFSLQTLPCVHHLLLDGYFLFGIEENPLNTPNSALLRDYLFLFHFSREGFWFFLLPLLFYTVLDFTFMHNLFSLR